MMLYVLQYNIAYYLYVLLTHLDFFITDASFRCLFCHSVIKKRLLMTRKIPYRPYRIGKRVQIVYY